MPESRWSDYHSLFQHHYQMCSVDNRRYENLCIVRHILYIISNVQMKHCLRGAAPIGLSLKIYVPRIPDRQTDQQTDGEINPGGAWVTLSVPPGSWSMPAIGDVSRQKIGSSEFRSPWSTASIWLYTTKTTTIFGLRRARGKAEGGRHIPRLFAGAWNWDTITKANHKDRLLDDDIKIAQWLL